MKGQLSNIGAVLENLMKIDPNIDGNQNELARRTDISQPTIQRILSGSSPRKGTVNTLADFFKVSPHQLQGVSPINYEEIRANLMPKPKVEPKFNQTLLIDILISLEASLKRKRFAPKPAPKGQLIGLLYAYYADRPDSKIEPSWIDNYVDLAKSK